MPAHLTIEFTHLVCKRNVFNQQPAASRAGFYSLDFGIFGIRNTVDVAIVSVSFQLTLTIDSMFEAIDDNQLL